MKRRTTFVVAMTTMLVALSVTAGTAVASEDDGDENTRREWYKAYDHNGDKRWKGKDTRIFRKEHPHVFENLMGWCERAVNKPKKHDVAIPKDTKASKVKCKKSRIDAPYMKAWVRATAEREADDPKHPAHGGKEEKKKKEGGHPGHQGKG